MQYPRPRRLNTAAAAAAGGAAATAVAAPAAPDAAATEPANPLYRLQLGQWWAQFKREGLAFWGICGYLIVEYIRPQNLIPGLDVIPVGMLVLMMALAGRVTEKNARWVSDPANLLMVMFHSVIILSCFTAEYPQVSWALVRWARE